MILTKLLRSFVFQQVLRYTVLSLVSMAMLFGFIYWATAGYMVRQTDATIEEEILGLSEEYDRVGLLGLSGIIEERVALYPQGPPVYLLVNADYNPVVGNLSEWPDVMLSENGWTRFRLAGRGKDHSQVHEVRARTFDFRDGLHLVVGRDINDLNQTRELIFRALTYGMAITLVLSLGVGLFMSSRVMRRIEAVNQTSLEIMEGDLSRRIPITGSGDDFDKLSENLNHMLERIEQLMITVRQVSDNIAHDLRTPLTRLRTRLEQARSGEQQVIQSEIDAAITDAEELLSTFNALLRIARLESGSSKTSFTALDISSLVRDIAELYEPVAAEKKQRLVVEAKQQVLVQADQHLLFQALANLLENAIKHTPAGTTITLSTATTSAGQFICIADNGPGIPAELYEKVLQRFYRTDASRSTPGNGLGLSLVHAIINIHNAKIELSDNQPGLRVSLQF